MPESKFTPEVIEDIFTYHAPNPGQVEKMQNIRVAARDFAKVLVANTPACPDQTVAIRGLRELVMCANQSIILDGKY